MALPNHAKVLPGIWGFTRKRDHSAKANFVFGVHRQILGRDYFAHKNYCAVLSSHDNRTLLTLGANEGWTVHQTDIVQAFLHGILNDADQYMQPPACFPCPLGFVCKLLRAIYGLHQAPVKNYTPANSSETIWICRQGTSVLTRGLYADDFLHHINDPNMYKVFQMTPTCIRFFNRTLPNSLKLSLGKQQYFLAIESQWIPTNRQ
jgi:hypothetical protein